MREGKREREAGRQTDGDRQMDRHTDVKTQEREYALGD